MTKAKTAAAKLKAPARTGKVGKVAFTAAMNGIVVVHFGDEPKTVQSLVHGFGHSLADWQKMADALAKGGVTAAKGKVNEDFALSISPEYDLLVRPRATDPRLDCGSGFVDRKYAYENPTDGPADREDGGDLEGLLDQMMGL